MFGQKPHRIYLDYASATPVLPESLTATTAAMQLAGNPGSLHHEGVVVEELLEESREQIARELNCKARELIFTSGGTESNNLAILGFARKLAQTRSLDSVLSARPLVGTHWIVSAIEHSSVLGCLGEVERLGGSVSFVDPDARGIITPEAISNLLKPETVFVSVGWANSEIGVVQPLAQIAKVLKAHEAQHTSQIIFHTDAGQAMLYKASTVRALGVDMLSIDSGKLYGPRGIGALWIDNRVALDGIMFGGKQERNLRAGTENPALAAGFAAALRAVALERTTESERLENMRDNFAREIIAHIPDVVINTDMKHSLPHMLNISIPNINSEYLVLALDHRGISLSTKSACHEGEESQSHVVACLVEAAAKNSGTESQTWRARNTLRFSLGRDTTSQNITAVMSTLTVLVPQLQQQYLAEKA